jgi:endonuclease/exonuclease/phosphatase family metal-dependent hydrolase
MTNDEWRMTNDEMKKRAIGVLVCLVAGFMTVGARAELPAEFRVVTYNIHHGEGIDSKFDLPRIAKVVLAEKPDIIALQEVDQKTKRAGGVDQPAEFARLTGMEVVFGRNIDYDGGGYGTAVLTRLPVRSSESVKLKSYYAPSQLNPEQRGVQIVELGDNEGPTLLFLCTHLDYRPPDDERMNSALTINELIRKRGDTLAIIAGDINARPESRVIREFAKEWKIAGLETTGSDGAAGYEIVPSSLKSEGTSRGRPILTCPSAKPDRWIDYVMCRPAARWQVIEVRVLDEDVASDHRAMLAVLRPVQ